MPASRFILASASPRRHDLLREAGYRFDIDPANIDETAYPSNLLPAEVALHVAEAKARAVMPRHPDRIILAADTVVAFGDQLIGKPADASDARRILQLLSGTSHLCITGVCVTNAAVDFFKSARVMSLVQMRFLTPAEIDRYIESGHWEGKAGGYGIQDDDPFVIRLAGCRTNIVGLPMTTTCGLLADAGISPPPREPV